MLQNFLADDEISAGFRRGCDDVAVLDAIALSHVVNVGDPLGEIESVLADIEADTLAYRPRLQGLQRIHAASDPHLVEQLDLSGGWQEPLDIASEHLAVMRPDEMRQKLPGQIAPRHVILGMITFLENFGVVRCFVTSILLKEDLRPDRLGAEFGVAVDRFPN